MSYRRRPDAMDEARRYEAFCLDSAALMASIGLPTHIINDHAAFMDFLMHGSTPPGAPLPFGIGDMTPQQRHLYVQMLSKYLEAGLPDPGISGLAEAEDLKIRRAPVPR